MKVLVTKDTMSDIYLAAVKIRQQVFVKEQHVTIEEEIDQNEAYAIHFVLYLADKPVATVRLLPLNDTELKLQRMAVLKDYRGQNLGATIIREAEKFAREQHFKKIKLDAQLTAQKFYEKLGYQAFGEIFQDARIDHIHMEKEL
ncbi:GNAT family N-acetyltransferase [Enterococcus sp. CSURQ0835]|uniref:GNAT family N-acetyltransferase n=1 Tax=Enterococcus sp. CSURQ0835 TaxID=2681394 RepID=UPI00135BB171|nr:GNAT family N-acetyltransferase [Enterococcus sp. CSURQ0835]